MGAACLLKGEYRIGDIALIGDLIGDLIGEWPRQSLSFQYRERIYPLHDGLLQQQNNIYLLYQINMNQQTVVPSFSVYSVGSECSKTCFESQNITLLCNITGPYFERNKIKIDPVINCHIQGSKLSEQCQCYMMQKIKQIFGLAIVKEKYLRMNFDITYHIVEMRNQDQLLPALVNLLSFTAMLVGIEIKSVFSCSQIWLKDQKVSWIKPQGNQHKNKSIKKMCLAIQSSQKQIIYCEFDGEFIFVHFQRLSNLLMDANQQISNYIIRKVGQINEQ